MNPEKPMNFQEFLARKRALALVEHMDTLSEADAQQLFDSLDAETVEFVEMVLSENLPLTLQPVGDPRVRRFGRRTSYSGVGKTHPTTGKKLSKKERMELNQVNRYHQATERVLRLLKRGVDMPGGVKAKNIARAEKAEERAAGQVRRQPEAQEMYKSIGL